MSTTTKIPTMATTEYPVRYVAFDNPGTLVINASRKCEGGNEWAILTQTMTNRRYPHIEDGVYAEIHSFQHRDLTLDVYATTPTESRSVWHRRKDCAYADFEAALLQLQVWFLEAKAFCEGATL